MTLRTLLMTVNLDEVYRLINEKDSTNIAACDRPTMEMTVKSYTHVVKELLSKPKVKKYSMPFCVCETKDFLDGTLYADVHMLNTKYVAPKKGLKPWGGQRGKPIPKGHYDCNANKHNKRFACGMEPWSKIIDNEIINETKYSLEKIAAEMLWELTFYGWSEESHKTSVNALKDRLKEALKEIKSGKCIELPPKKKGGFKVVIPDSVTKQIIDIANKEATKRKKK
jgi:hypothetical protein